MATLEDRLEEIAEIDVKIEVIAAYKKKAIEEKPGVNREVKGRAGDAKWSRRKG